MFWKSFLTALALCLAVGTAQAQSGRAYLGVYGEDPPAGSKDQGAMVKEVAPEGPADKAGLKSGDRIIAVNDQEIGGFEDLKVRLGGYKAGEKIQFKVIRDGKEMSIDVVLADAPKRRPAAERERPGDFRFRVPFGDKLPEGLEEQLRERFQGAFPDAGQPMIGVQAQPIDEALRERLGLGKDVKGVLVAEVVAEGPANKAGVEPEDVLVAVDGKEVESPEQLRDAVQAKKAGDVLKLSLVRDGKELEKEVKVEVGAQPQFPLGELFNPEELNSRLEQFRGGLDDLNKRREELQGRMEEMEKQAERGAQKALESLEKRLQELEKSTQEKLDGAAARVRELEEKLAELAKKLEAKSEESP